MKSSEDGLGLSFPITSTSASSLSTDLSPRSSRVTSFTQCRAMSGGYTPGWE
jgi:hypothetical protein